MGLSDSLSQTNVECAPVQLCLLSGLVNLTSGIREWDIPVNTLYSSAGAQRTQETTKHDKTGLLLKSDHLLKSYLLPLY